MDYYLKKLKYVMKAYGLEGGILHESLKKAMVFDDVDDFNIESDIGIDPELKEALNELIEEYRKYSFIPF